MSENNNNTCQWPNTILEKEYHDKEWGIPKHDEKILFEFLVLEMMQAGLSWAIILNKREGMRDAFSDFDVVKISQYDDTYKNELLQNPNIIRNRLKINALILNAQLFIAIQKEFGSFDKYIWAFVENKPIVNTFTSLDEMPVNTMVSDEISKDLKKRGFKFVGSTICYSYMQAIGMTNDHLISCKHYHQCSDKN